MNAASFMQFIAERRKKLGREKKLKNETVQVEKSIELMIIIVSMKTRLSSIIIFKIA